MPARYAAKGNAAMTTTAATALTVGSNATTAQRNIIREFLISFSAPSDSHISCSLQRTTALGTSTAVTPALMDAADRAAQAAVGKAHTTEPTYAAAGFLFELFYINARAVFRWVATAPNEGLTHAATVGVGIGWNGLHASVTPTMSVQAFWDE